MKKIFVFVLLVSLAAIYGCGDSQISTETPLCEAPYIEQRTCCLDADSDSVCDEQIIPEEDLPEPQNGSVEDVPPETIAEETPAEPECGDSICNGEENCRTCFDDCACSNQRVCSINGTCNQMKIAKNFDLYVGTSSGIKLNNTFHATLGERINFFVWIKKNTKYRLDCNYSTYLNWEKKENDEIRLYEKNETYVMTTMTMPDYLGGKIKSRTYFYRFIFDCEGETEELPVFVRYP